jgi:hypothetical protein
VIITLRWLFLPSSACAFCSSCLALAKMSGVYLSRARGLRDLDRIDGLVKLQGRLVAWLDRVQHRVLTGRLHVSSARQQVEVHIHGVDDARCLVFVDRILQHHQIARRGHGEVGLGGNDQRKLLQIGGHFHFGLGAAGHHLTQVHRPALGRDGPQYVGQVFRAEAVGRHQALKFGIDEGLPLAGYVRLALSLGQEAGPGKTDFVLPLRCQ